MRKLSWTAAAACAALAWTSTAGATVPTPSAAGPPTTPAPTAAPPKPAPLSIFAPRPDGAVTHLQSGLVCPAAINGYKRVDAHAFDGFGLDVDCNYDHGDAFITLYLTRRTGGSLAADMAAAKRDFVQIRAEQHPVFVAESQPVMGGRTWDAALYNDDDNVRDAIWFADLDGWTFEYRATYAAAVEPRVAGDLAALTTQVVSTAGAQLDLCARSQTPVRTGEAVSGAKLDSATAVMTAIMAVGAKSAAADSAAKGQPVEAAKPITWCVEGPQEIDKTPMLLWRGVYPDSADAGADMMSVMTLGEPPDLVVASNAEANLVQKELGKAALWTATLSRHGHTEVDGYFTDRPRPEALGALMAAIFTGKAHPLAAYDDKGKNVTIYMPPK